MSFVSREIRKATAIRNSLSRSQKREIGTAVGRAFCSYDGDDEGVDDDDDDDGGDDDN